MKARFSVSGPGDRRSATWSLFAWKNDVYLASVDAGGMMKASFHASGDWQYGYTAEHVRRLIGEGTWDRESRHWQRWKRPAPFADGYTLALKIFVLFAALRPRSKNVTNKPVHRVHLESAEKGVCFTMVFAAAGTTESPWKSQQDILRSENIGTLALPNGETVWFDAHFVEGSLVNELMFRSFSDS